jgi:hypothetical protein
MDVRLLYPSLYLGAPDLYGKDANLTIRRLVVEELKTERGSERKPILYFEETKAKAEKAGTPEKEKRLVLNKTNAMSIAAIHGNEVDGWKGKCITLYPTKAQAFGKQVDCIRVRDTAPATATKET